MDEVWDDDARTVLATRSLLLEVTADAYCELEEVLGGLPLGRSPAGEARAAMTGRLEQVVRHCRDLRARAVQQRRRAATRAEQARTMRALHECRHELLADAAYAIALLDALDDDPS